MYNRELSNELTSKIKKYGIISLTGPRQSGKTTLVKNTFPKFKYVNLEIPETRFFAQDDPSAFLEQAKDMIIDEIQRVPDLISYIQGIYDENKERRFILTGSQNLLISEKISQSLSGRVAILKLLPLSIREMRSEEILESLDEQVFKGFYPRIYDENLVAAEWYDFYVQTYLERDVRNIKNIGDLTKFMKFLKLLAGRAGQILNMSSLSSDVGVSVPTIKSWLSVLEASYVIFRLKPFYKNFSKRLIKSPKIYFYDTGLICSLLDINTVDQFKGHPLIGNIFENAVISNYLKNAFNQGKWLDFYYWREVSGKEVDLVFEEGGDLNAVEVKYGKTIKTEMASNLLHFKDIADTSVNAKVVYGGNKNQKRSHFEVVSWRDL
jgi:hypothetical protein